MNLNLKYIFLMLIYSLSINAQSPSSSAGTASNLMLRFGTSTRATGLSEAFTGLANDENALLYNPGGLPNIRMGIISLNHVEWFEDIRIDNLIFGYNLNGNLGTGLSISHMWMPAIQGKDEIGRETELFNVSSSIVNLGIGYKLHPGFYIGIGAKYFEDNLAEFSASGVALDFGLFIRTVVPGLTVGLAVQNFGGDIQYDKEKQRIPLVYRAGIAYKLYRQHLTFSTDAVKSIDADLKVNFGVEYTFRQLVSLRLGNRFSENEMFVPAFGAGLHLKKQFHLNYTFFDLSDLGNTHRIGFSFHFNIPSISKWRKSLTRYSKSLVLIPPKKVNVELKQNKLIISWNVVDGAEYNVYAKFGEKGRWKKITTKTLVSTSLKINNLPTKGKYFFRVTSIIKNKESKFSKETAIDVK